MLFREADVPRSLAENLEYRQDLNAMCRANGDVRKAVWKACQKDLLFWIGAFCWTFNPKLAKQGAQADLPFVTWEFQDRALRVMDENLGHLDIGIEKSRDTGATWLCLAILLHRWLFRRNQVFMVSSRNERLVDFKNNPDTLFWKLRYVLKHLPPFLMPRSGYEDTKLSLHNPEMHSTIDGAASTADLGRGGRRTCCFMDEFDAWEVGDSHEANAATFANTDCRLFNSTYKSTIGAYYQQMQRPDIVKIRMGWWEHPEREGNLGKDEQGNWRSSYYKTMCRKLGSPVLVARELDINPEHAAGAAFPEALLAKLRIETCRPEVARGRIEFDPLKPKEPVFIEDADGVIRLWLPYRSDGRLPHGDEFVVGLDISQGAGATPSVASVANKKTREKVAEFVTAHLSPEKFADAVHLLALWFHDAFLIWEGNGPGGSFGKRLVEDLCYRKVYYRQDEQGLTKKTAPSMTPGWNASPTNKDLVIRAYLTALSTGSFINRSREAIDECRDYVFQRDGGIGNPRAGWTPGGDPSGAKKSHADRVIADALANKALGGAPDDAKIILDDDPLRIPDNPPPGSLAARRKQWQNEQSPESRWSTPPQVLDRWNLPRDQPMRW